MPRPEAPADGIERLAQRLDSITRRLDLLEQPDGAQLARARERIEQLISDLPTLINASLTGGFTTGSMIATGNVSVGGTATVTGAAFFAEAYANPVTTSYFAAYLNGDNRLGRTVSSARYKRDISRWTPNVQAIFALQLVTFRLNTSVEEVGDAAPVEWGLIAEELVALGLTWLVIFVDGKPEGIAYERIALAMLPIVQDHENRLRSLEGVPLLDEPSIQSDLPDVDVLAMPAEIEPGIGQSQ